MYKTFYRGSNANIYTVKALKKYLVPVCTIEKKDDGLVFEKVFKDKTASDSKSKNLTEKLRITKREVDDCMNENLDLYQQIEDLKQGITCEKEEVQDLKKQLEDKENEVKSLQSKVDYCKKNHKQLAKKLEDTVNKYTKVTKQQGDFIVKLYIWICLWSSTVF